MLSIKLWLAVGIPVHPTAVVAVVEVRVLCKASSTVHPHHTSGSHFFKDLTFWDTGIVILEEKRAFPKLMSQSNKHYCLKCNWMP